MLVKNNHSYWASLGLIVVILLTRTNHFGDGVYLPDATLAVLFLGGLLVARKSWLGLAIAAAFAMDFYALGWKGVSEYCMSLGYWGLIPTYVIVWASGRWLAKRSQDTHQNLFNLPAYALVSLSTISFAFIVSNAFWYAFSDKVSTLSVFQFGQAIAQYYIPYISYAMMYLGLAWAVANLFSSVDFTRLAKS